MIDTTTTPAAANLVVHGNNLDETSQLIDNDTPATPANMVAHGKKLNDDNDQLTSVANPFNYIR